MIRKIKVYAIVGIMFLLNAVFCFGVFFATYREKKSLASSFWALAVAFGAAGASLMALYSSKQELRIQNLKDKISEKDHWFHSFEYPRCSEPKVDIDPSVFPKVETEDE